MRTAKYSGHLGSWLEFGFALPKRSRKKDHWEQVSHFTILSLFLLTSLRIYICANGTDGGICKSTNPTSRPNIAANVTFFIRKATVVAACSNFSIIDISNLSPPALITDLDITAYRAALTWLLNFTAADIPAPSSIAENFWAASDQLSEPSTYGPLLQNFHSILIFPFWLFNANNYGNTDLQEQQAITSLPPGFYTQASVVELYFQIRFDRTMCIKFIILHGLAMVFSWAVLLGLDRDWCRETSANNFLSTFDVVFKARVDIDIDAEEGLDSESSDVIRLGRDGRTCIKMEWLIPTIYLISHWG